MHDASNIAQSSQYRTDQMTQRPGSNVLEGGTLPGVFLGGVTQ